MSNRSGRIRLNNVRLAFPALFQPKPYRDDSMDKARFGAALLIEKTDPQLTAFRMIMGDVAREKWGAKAETLVPSLRAGDKVCLRDGDAKGEKYQGFEGCFYVGAYNKARPVVIDRNRATLTEADGKPYAGCYVNAVVEVYAGSKNPGINAQLVGVQFHADGDAFAGSAPASIDEFDDMSADEVEPGSTTDDSDGSDDGSGLF